MPISSGALGWPASYFRESGQEEDEATHNATYLNHQNEAAGNPGIWRVKLTDREEYDRWKESYDKQERKKKKKKKKHKEKEAIKREKELARNDVTSVLQRYRRRRCLLLSCVLLLVFASIFYGLVFIYTFYLNEDSLEPVVSFDSKCGGRWREHFLAYNTTLKNGTEIYYCCYLPDVNKTTLTRVLSQGDVWPKGFLIKRNDCQQSGRKCEEFEKNNLFPQGTPPCSFSYHVTPTIYMIYILQGIIWVFFYKL